MCWLACQYHKNKGHLLLNINIIQYTNYHYYNYKLFHHRHHHPFLLLLRFPQVLSRFEI